MEVLGDMSGEEWADLLVDSELTGQETDEACNRDTNLVEDMSSGGRGQTSTDKMFAHDLQDRVKQGRYIQTRIKELFGFEPKKEQIEALCCLIYDRTDLVLVAGTSFGKSLIFQAAPLIHRRAQKDICLIVAPLKAIEKEQVQYLETIPGAVPILLDEDSNTKEVRGRIAAGRATHGNSFFDNLEAVIANRC